jgi:hypothetical protein
MKKRVLRFREYVSEQLDPTTPPDTTTPSSEAPPNTGAPETEREAKSRIAKGLLKGLFGDIKGIEGGIDSLIEQTPEVKEARPYKGCGANEPYELERKPMSLETAKILLEYLDSKGKGDYKRALKELDENRALILGIRNKIDVKNDSANNDRFTDSLYLFPQEANKESQKHLEAAAEERAKKEKERQEKEAAKQKKAKDDPFSRMTKKGGETKEEVEEIDLGEKYTPYQITTSPSLAYYGEKPVNPKGTGIKLPGDTLYYLQDRDIGHGKYKMMVEGEPIDVGRYPIGVTKYDTYLPANKFKEHTGMQIHRSSTKGKGICIGPWSAGCQVFDDINEYDEFINKATQQTNNGNKFIYALIQLDDIPDTVFEKAMKGERATGDTATEPPLASTDNQEPAEVQKDKPKIVRGVSS